MKDKKSLLIMALVVIGTVGMLYGLAKLGTRTGSSGNTSEDLKQPVVANEHIRGPVNAPVTLVEYSDFQCPACRTYEPTLKNLLVQYDQELRIIYRHFPLTSLHKNAQKAAYASEAANLQGKFWEMHDMLFNTQDKWSDSSEPETFFLDYARSLGLDQEKFKKDMESEEVKNVVAEQARAGEQQNLTGTPTFFLNGKLFTPPQTYDGFSQAVVEQLILTGNNEVTSTTK